jgi:hypothetical protein
VIDFIRAIQDDAWESGRKSATEQHRGHAACQSVADCQLVLAIAQMNIADRDPRGDITGFEIQSARDNATEHRRIAEAYIALAQAMKA